MIIEELKSEIEYLASKSIFSPDLNCLTNEQWLLVVEDLKYDYKRYYISEIEFSKIKYFRGLLATFFYRISRFLYLNGLESNALEYSSLGFLLTSVELYYSADIGKGLKINHGSGTVVGSRTVIGENVLLHQCVTLGEKNNGRAKIGDNVTIYPGAIIVGDIFIGDNSIIGANVFVDKSYPNNSKIV